MKVLASDYDRTLFFRDHGDGFKEEDVKAIEQFQKDGNLFGMCTGRPIGGFVKNLKGYIHPDFYIMSTGGIILDKDCNVLWGKSAPFATIKEIVEKYPDAKILPQSGRKDYLYGTFDEDLENNHKHIDSIDFFKDESLYSISLILPEEKRAKVITDEINAVYSDVTAYQNVDSVDILSTGCSKGNGLLKLKEMLEIESIAGIGDSYNDVPMLDAADVSFTFHSSPEDIQENVSYVVDSIAEAIEILEK